MTMTKKYKILGKYIKDMSSETPDIETYVFVRDYISKYQLNIDINSKPLKNKMIVSVDRVIPIDWTDYNGHMNEGRYGQVFSDAADGFLSSVGVDSEYIDSGNSYFTVENHIKYLNETLAGEHIYVDTSVLLVDGKKLKLFHTMRRKTDKIELATCEQFLLHVDLSKRKSSEPVGEVASKLQEIFK